MVQSVPAMASTEQLLGALRRTPARGGAKPSAIIDRVQEWKGLGESMVKSLADCFSDIESREENLRVVSESLEKRLRDLKEKEKDLKLLQEGKREALKLREEELKSTEEELKSREEKLDEQLKLVHEHIESLEASHGEAEVLRKREREKLKEIEKRERQLDVARGSLEKRLGEFEKNERQKLNEIEKREKELNVVRGSLEKRLGELEKREKEFDALNDRKLRELTLKEEVFVKEKRNFAEEIRLENEKLQEKQNLGRELVKRLELALKMLDGMNVRIDDRFKEIESRETTAHESLTARLNEADLIRESLEKRFKELEDIEKELNLSQKDKTKKPEPKEQQLVTVRVDEVELRRKNLSEQQKLGNEPEGKKKELELNLVSCKKEHDYEEHDSGKKSLSSVRESAQTCVKENLALSKLDQPQRQSVVTDARLVADKGIRQGSKQSLSTDTTNAHLTTKQDKAVPALQKERFFKEMLVKCHELKGDDICKFLSLSCEPAKLVLEIVEEFYAFRSGMLETECKERRVTTHMLDQLTMMSPKIQPCVTEAAIKLAFQWKSEMSSASENPMGALVFLHLVAAFNLSSHFDKNELFSFLTLAAKHKQTPDLCRTLGLVEKIPGYIHKLINEKEYLVASTYIHVYQLQKMFPQGAILNYYVTRSKWLANATSRNQRYAKEKAIASEIDALLVAVEHIIGHGLESDYSPNALTARIKQLEATRANMKKQLEAKQANLRRGNPSSANIQENREGRHWRKNWGKFRKGNQRFNQEPRESEAVALDHQIAPWHDSWSSPTSAWRPQPQHQHQHVVTQTETPLTGLPHSWVPVNSVPMPHHPVEPYKRRRLNVWMNKGGLHEGKFANSQY